MTACIQLIIITQSLYRDDDNLLMQRESCSEEMHGIVLPSNLIKIPLHLSCITDPQCPQTTGINNFSLSSLSLNSINFSRSFELSLTKLAALAVDLVDWTEMKLTLRQ
jgi:hypothetical protein